MLTLTKRSALRIKSTYEEFFKKSRGLEAGLPRGYTAMSETLRTGVVCLWQSSGKHDVIVQAYVRR